MKKIVFVICLSLCFYGCKSSKQATRKTSTTSSRPSKPIIDHGDTKTTTHEYPKINEPNGRNSTNPIVENIIDYAKQFDGVRYKYGGTTKKGMDCSGLVTTAFSSEGIVLPRSSGDIALTGDWIDIKQVQRGDLLFFATNGKSRTVNHVALVTHVNEGQVEFMHATTSAGVITSSLAERYWYFAFVQARRVL